VTDPSFCSPLSDWAGGGKGSRKEPLHKTVPETDTGGLVEYTQALERSVPKELGKLPS
jgi:hypothetical protein